MAKFSVEARGVDNFEEEYAKLCAKYPDKVVWLATKEDGQMHAGVLDISNQDIATANLALADLKQKNNFKMISANLGSG